MKWQPLERATYKPRSQEQRQKLFDHAKATFPQYNDERIWKSISDSEGELGELWMNDIYQVHVIRHEGEGPDDDSVVIQLSIKRIDQGPCRDWRHFQRIKNELVGRECEGVELYPAESRLVDTANQFHIWCVSKPGWRWPIGYNTERTVSGKSGGGAVQRPFIDDEL